MTPACVFGAAAESSDHVPGQILLQWRASTKPDTVMATEHVSQAVRSLKSVERGRNVSVRKLQGFSALGIEAWQADADVDVNALAQTLSQREDIVFAEPNYRRYPRLIPDDDLLSLGRYQQINLPQAWDITQGNRAVRVAVIDDGFDLNHEDLRANWNLDLARDFVDGDSTPSPGNCVDPDTPGSTVPEVHGTLVAGLIAAANNGIGIVGAAPNIQLIPLRVGCLYSVANELQAIEYAISQGVDIINASYGGPMFSEAERVAMSRLQNQDILFVAAAGNFHVNSDLQPDYPASIDLPNVLAVAASDADNRLTDWTQYGASSVDVAAPGVDLVSTFAEGGYSNPLGGTSFSAPLVTGTAALLKSYQPSASFRDLKGAIMATVNPLSGDVARLATDGQVNARAALQAIAGAPQPVIVVAKVVVDDTSFGNENHWPDPGETVRMDVTLENVWHASGDLHVRLSADADNQVGILTSVQRYGELNPLVDEGRQTRSFWLQIPEHSTYQEAVFRLDINDSVSGRTWQRHLNIPMGSITFAEALNHTINRTGMRQDDVHYYRVDVPPMGSRDLIFQVEAKNGTPVSLNLDILVSKDRIPVFDYVRYALPDPVAREGVAPGVRVGAHVGVIDEVIIEKPAPGSWYIAVVVPDDVNTPNLRYELIVDQFRQARTYAATGGCGLFTTGKPPFDPLLPLILLIAALRLLLKHVKRPAFRPSAA